jgi:hypothetical protein
MHWFIVLFCGLATLVLQASAVACDLAPITFGCTVALSNTTLLGAAVDIVEALPFEIVHTAPGTGQQAPLVLSQWTASEAPRAMLQLSATSNKTGIKQRLSSHIEMNADDGALILSASNGPVVLLQDAGATRITIDSITGCILINGDLPLQSPCRINANNTSVTSVPSPPMMVTVGITVWMLVVSIVGALILGIVLGCFLGCCAMKRRLRPMLPGKIENL